MSCACKLLLVASWCLITSASPSGFEAAAVEATGSGQDFFDIWAANTSLVRAFNSLIWADFPVKPAAWAIFNNRIWNVAYAYLCLVSGRPMECVYEPPPIPFFWSQNYNVVMASVAAMKTRTRDILGTKGRIHWDVVRGDFDHHDGG